MRGAFFQRCLLPPSGRQLPLPPLLSQQLRRRLSLRANRRQGRRRQRSSQQGRSLVQRLLQRWALRLRPGRRLLRRVLPPMLPPAPFFPSLFLPCHFVFSRPGQIIYLCFHSFSPLLFYAPQWPTCPLR